MRVPVPDDGENNAAYWHSVGALPDEALLDELLRRGRLIRQSRDFRLFGERWEQMKDGHGDVTAHRYVSGWEELP